MKFVHPSPPACVFTSRRRGNENETIGSGPIGRQFTLRAGACLFRHWRRRLGLLCATASAGGLLRTPAVPRTGLRVGLGPLVSGRAALHVERGLLGAETLCRRILGGPALLPPPVLSRLL